MYWIINHETNQFAQVEDTAVNPFPQTSVCYLETIPVTPEDVKNNLVVTWSTLQENTAIVMIDNAIWSTEEYRAWRDAFRASNGFPDMHEYALTRIQAPARTA